MSGLLKADLYCVMKSRLSKIALILSVSFPVVMVLIYVGIRMISGLGGDEVGDTLFNANSVIGSVYSLSNNIGLVIPAFAGILVCSDYSNGTLRNKVIAGNRRSEIYLSHLIVSIIFSVVIITIYAAVTAGLSLAMLPFNREVMKDLGKEVLYFVLNGTMTFAFIATVSTLFAMTFRSMAPTIIFTIVFAMALYVVNSVVMLTDFEDYKYVVYFIPTFAGNVFNLSSFSLAGLINWSREISIDLVFVEAMLSYLFFGSVNTLIGLLAFRKRDVR